MNAADFQRLSDLRDAANNLIDAARELITKYDDRIACSHAVIERSQQLIRECREARAAKR